MRAEARVATEHAGRYLVQLCKHFGHRVPARFADGVGRVEFPDGVADLVAEPGVLVLRVLAAEPAGVERLSGVLARHLERFAFRESLDVVWTAD
jgi:hypothetical protein